MSDSGPGYSDTPTLPSSTYCVHDPTRPRPPAIDPGGAATKAPPSDATVLFDGTDLSAWEGADGGLADWNVTDGRLETHSNAGDIRTTEDIGDCQLHLEWAVPAGVDGEGQDRGNSGVFLMDRYEIQVLDCYENPTYADGYAAAIYGQRPPMVNACREPGEWQSYDIVWRGPRFDGDELTRPARATVSHNGVVVQDATELLGPTTHRDVRDYEPHPPEAPLRLQYHGDRMLFRNIWYRSLSE